MYSWIMKAFTSTRSPIVMRPSATPTAARQRISVNAMAMISCWPAFSTLSDCCDITAVRWLAASVSS